MTVGAALPDTIGTVWLRSRNDTPAMRAAVTSAVERIDWRPGGMSPHTILLVRRVVGTFDAASPGDVSGFEERMQSEIVRCWRSAVPLDGRPVPTTAPAVVARDLVELLAMYLVECSDGMAAHRWWWRSIERRLHLHASVAGTLVEHARIAPQVIAELRRRHRRSDVVLGMSDTDAQRIIAAVAAVHDLPERVESVVDQGEGLSTPLAATDTARNHRDGGWVGFVPPGAAPALLEALAIRMVDAPYSVRSHDLASQLLAGLAVDRLMEATTDGSPVGASSAGVAAGDVEPAEARRRVGRRAVANPVLAEESATRSAAPNDARDGPDVGWEPDPERPDEGSVRQEQGVPRSPTGHPASAVDVVDSPGLAADGIDPNTSDTDTDLLSGGDISGLGGVFLLIELTRRLDFPDVFEQTWKLSSTVGAWGALELVARSLLPFDAVDQRDPIWRVLTDLGGGRSGLERARSLPARGDVTIPDSWVTADAPVTGFWSIDDTLARDVRQGARRLLHSIAPAIASILAVSLDCDVDVLPDALFRRPSLLRCDRTHVDVHFPLDSATVPVRRAGLDRDPGWVPALGRVITYHFDGETPVARPA